MVAKPHLEDGGSARAGMPLARAQRLNARSASQRSSGMQIALAVAVVTAGIIGLSLYAGGGAELETQVASVMPQSEPTAAPDPNFAAVAATPEPKPIPAQTVVTPVQAKWMPPCIERIERRLKVLHEARSAETEWPVKQAGLQGLAQAGLDCKQATVEMNGNMELAQTALASMHVKWDRDAALLRLTIIDSLSQVETAEKPQAGGPPVDFVVQ